MMQSEGLDGNDVKSSTQAGKRLSEYSLLNFGLLKYRRNRYCREITRIS